MTVNRLSARVAANGHRRQLAALVRADALAAAAERLVRRAWRDVLAAVRDVRGPHDATRVTFAVRGVLAGLDVRLRTVFAAGLHRTARWSHAEAAAGLAAVLPRPALAALTESRQPVALTEDESAPSAPPGLLTLTPDAPAFGLPADFADLSAAAQRDLFQSLIFPPPAESLVQRIVYASGWADRLAAQTRLAAPEEVAATVFRSVVAGQPVKELVRELLPVVDGVRATARRVARDESMRVAHTMQQAAWNEVDDLILGYQVHAIDEGHSPRSREAHRKRHGTIYWKHPGPGQKGMDECPHPPYEADGSLAFNCLCYISPVLVDPDTIGA